MIQPLVKIALGVLIPLFAGMLAITRAQPYDDRDLRAFLLPPENCAAPCWGGIRPGITTLDEAVTLLQANRWIKQVIVTDQIPNAFISLAWSEQAPAFAGNPSLHMPAYLWARRGVIQLIVLPTRIPYVDVWSLLGQPGGGAFNVSGYRDSLTLGNRPNTRHTAIYFDGHVVMDTRVYCPISPSLFWNAPVLITYSSDAVQPRLPASRYDLTGWMFSPSCQS